MQVYGTAAFCFESGRSRLPSNLAWFACERGAKGAGAAKVGSNHCASQCAVRLSAGFSAFYCTLEPLTKVIILGLKTTDAVP